MDHLSPHGRGDGPQLFQDSVGSKRRITRQGQQEVFRSYLTAAQRLCPLLGESQCLQRGWDSAVQGDQVSRAAGQRRGRALLPDPREQAADTGEFRDRILVRVAMSVIH